MTQEIISNQKSIISLISGADIVVQLVLLILLFASIWSWTIIIHKWILVSHISKRTRYFERIFSFKNIDKIFERFQTSSSAPIEKVFIATIKKWKKMNENSDSSIISTTIMVKKNKCMNELENGLSYLATIAASTPFIGLFGTVWGIMHSFQSIAASKNTSLAIVAPGIAEALFATGIGLAVAIPALIFYNLLSSKINKIDDSLDDFSYELYSMLINSIKR
ncbi:MAG: MotA/TolQ/ExbB proton channel family protein [Alphaproteobacteria bacterium]|nr:MotA/TolQ/ExbB proton channel family protein [Alphaproteobacteria bacterium]